MQESPPLPTTSLVLGTPHEGTRVETRGSLPQDGHRAGPATQLLLLLLWPRSGSLARGAERATHPLIFVLSPILGSRSSDRQLELSLVRCGGGDAQSLQRRIVIKFVDNFNGMKMAINFLMKCIIFAYF